MTATTAYGSSRQLAPRHADDAIAGRDRAPGPSGGRARTRRGGRGTGNPSTSTTRPSCRAKGSRPRSRRCRALVRGAGRRRPGSRPAHPPLGLRAGEAATRWRRSAPGCAAARRRRPARSSAASISPRCPSSRRERTSAVQARSRNGCASRGQVDERAGRRRHRETVEVADVARGRGWTRSAWVVMPACGRGAGGRPRSRRRHPSYGRQPAAASPTEPPADDVADHVRSGPHARTAA